RWWWRRRHRHAVRRRIGGALVVGHGQGDGVGAAGSVGVRRVLGGRRPAVAEGPAGRADATVGISRGAGEGTGEAAAARRKRRDRRLVATGPRPEPRGPAVSAVGKQPGATSIGVRD